MEAKISIKETAEYFKKREIELMQEKFRKLIAAGKVDEAQHELLRCGAKIEKINRATRLVTGRK